MIDPSLITTIRVGELPPAPPTLDSKISHEVGTDLNFMTVQQLVAFLQPYTGVFQFESKVLVVDSAYVAANFDSTGLGKNICIGWAIRNGQNGTDNIDGTFSMAYGAVNNVLGQTGGSKDAVVVAHTHDIELYDEVGIGAPAGGNPAGLTNGTGISKSTGVSGINKNLPPFRIELHIMKL